MSKTDAKRCYDIVDRNPNLADEISVIRRADPSEHLCVYMDWLMKAYKRGEFRLEDIEQVKENMALFHKNKTRFTGTNKDINRFTYPTLTKFLADTFKEGIDITKVVSEDQDKKILYDGPLGTLIVPLTHKGSCEFGSGTKWCTAGASADPFLKYKALGTMYIWIDKQHVEKKDLLGGSKKFQFHFEAGQFADEWDRLIPSNVVKYYRNDHPVISQLFKAYEDRILKARDMSRIALHLGLIGSDELWPEGVNMLLSSPEAAYEHAKRILKRRWPIAEPYIAKDPYWAVRYLHDVAKVKSWQELTGDGSVDENIARSPKAAFWYIDNVLHARWPEAEPYIMQDIEIAAKYAMVYITGQRWPEAEPHIGTKRSAAISYIKYNLDMRWLEVEPLILSKEAYLADGGNEELWEHTISNDIIWYSQTILHDRWHEAEHLLTNNIATYLAYVVKGDDEVLSHRIFQRADVNEIYDYCNLVLKGRLPEAQEKLFFGLIDRNRTTYLASIFVSYTIKYIKARVPVIERLLISSFKQVDRWGSSVINISQYLNYALKCIKGRWDLLENELGSDVIDIENRIRLNPETGLEYAIAFFKMRMPELEKILMAWDNPNQARLLIKYAKHIIKGRWREAESIIVKSPYNIVYYCIEVLKSRWPDETPPVTYKRDIVEKYVLADLTSAIRYSIAFFPQKWSALDRKISNLKSLSMEDTNSDAIIDYCVHYRTGRLLHLEGEIMEFYWLASKYAHLVIGGRWLDFERKIDTRGFYSKEEVGIGNIVYYCKNVLKNRWYDMELFIKNSDYSSNELIEEYERDVVKGDWFTYE